MDTKKVLIGVAVAVVVIVAVCYMCKSPAAKEEKKNSQKTVEPFTYDQIALNAKNYSFVPRDNPGCGVQSKPDFVGMTCGGGSAVAGPLQGMTQQQIQNEIDLHYRKPMEMLEVKDLLPEADISGLSFGADPAEDFANKFVWHRTTNARVKRRNWETGAAMIRGDLIIDPGKQSWFQHTNDYRDLTPGFIPKSYCSEIDVEDLSYSMSKVI